MGRLTIPLLFSGPARIKKAKMDDLIFLLSFVPPHYHAFYQQLQAEGVSRDDSFRESGDSESDQSDECTDNDSVCEESDSDSEEY